MNSVGMKYEKDIPYQTKKIHYPLDISYKNNISENDRVIDGKYIYLYV